MAELETDDHDGEGTVVATSDSTEAVGATSDSGDQDVNKEPIEQASITGTTMEASTESDKVTNDKARGEDAEIGQAELDANVEHTASDTLPAEGGEEEEEKAKS